MPGAIAAPLIGGAASSLAKGIFGGGQQDLQTSAGGIDPKAQAFLQNQLDPSFLQGQPQDRALFQTLKNRAAQQQQTLSGQAANTLAAQGVQGGAAAQPLLAIQQQTQQGLADQLGNIDYQNLQRREAMQQAAAQTLLGNAQQQAGLNAQLQSQQNAGLGALGASIGNAGSGALFGKQVYNPQTLTWDKQPGFDFGAAAKNVGNFFSGFGK